MAEGGERLCLALRNESVLAAVAVAQALMQVPAAGKDVRQPRATHKARVVAVPPANLLYRAAKEHHRVGGFEIDPGPEGELDLARPKLHLQRPQRQSERFDRAPQDLKYLVINVISRFCQKLITRGQQADIGRNPRLPCIGRREMGIFQLEDVAFDLEPRDVIEAAPVQLIEYAAAQLTGAERHGPAVGEIEVAKQPAAVRRPRYYLEAERIRHQEQIGRALHLRHVEAAATGEDGKDGAVRSIFREQARWCRATAAECAFELGGHQGLAAQYAVLVGK